MVGSGPGLTAREAVHPEAPSHRGAYSTAQPAANCHLTFAHAERAGALPHHHRDPFGRMLVAQA